MTFTSRGTWGWIGVRENKSEGDNISGLGWGDFFSLAFIVMIKYTKMELMNYDSSNLMNSVFFHLSLPRFDDIFDKR